MQVDAPREQVLSGPRLTGDQHRRVSGSDQVANVQDAGDRRGLPQKPTTSASSVGLVVGISAVGIATAVARIVAGRLTVHACGRRNVRTGGCEAITQQVRQSQEHDYQGGPEHTSRSHRVELPKIVPSDRGSREGGFPRQLSEGATKQRGRYLSMPDSGEAGNRIGRDRESPIATSPETG